MSEENNMMDTTICPQEDNCAEELKMPSVMQMTKNLMTDGSKIVNNALQGNKTLVSDEIRESRWSVCQSCPFLQNDRCTQCGCFMKVKVAFHTSKCPEGKW